MARGNSPTGTSASRDASLDVGRYLLLVGVIALHLMALVPADRFGWWSIAVLNLSHIAVPVYLIVAGYFLSWRTRSYRRCVTQPIIRLVPLHLFWLGIYIVHYEVTMRFAWDWGPQILFNGGPAYHLWFLPALLVALILVAVTSRVAGLWGALLVCAILAAIGLSRGAFHDMLGMPGTAQRAGILMAPMFVWMGAAMRAFFPDRVDRRMIWAIVAVLIVMQAVENAVFSHLSAGHVMIVRAFPLTMFATGAAVFLAIRSIPASLWPQWLVEQSRCTLGVYAVHLLVIYSIGGWIVPTGPVSLLLLVAIVLAISSLIARAMTMIRPLQRFVI
ncbi:acyltransferase [Sphingomonas cynarae]|uniref:acyltransferase n=1 Tax=Sphingomonas cynarae TaxID=930197 RepID=UPI0031D69039